MKTRALQCVCISWPCDDLDRFYGKVNIGHIYSKLLNFIEGKNLCAQKMGKKGKNIMNDPRGYSDPVLGLYT